MSQPEIKRIIVNFTAAVTNLKLALLVSLEGLHKAIVTGEAEIANIIENGLILSGQTDEKLYRFQPAGTHSGIETTQNSIKAHGRFLAARRELEQKNAACGRLPADFFPVLARLYDTYLSKLLSYTSSISIEGRDAPLRVQTVDQLSWLERQLDIDLKTQLSLSAEFLDVMARMRLFSDGDSEPAGAKVEISSESFYADCDVIYEAGVELGQLIWRRAFPEQTAKANAALQDLAFNLIQEQRYGMARKLLSFARSTFWTDADENNRSVFLINSALAAYLAGDKEDSVRILEAQDWSASSDILRLAHAVLTSRLKEAAALMQTIGSDARPSKTEYLAWPLFREFRNTAEFAETFGRLFGEVTLRETDLTPLHRSATA